MTYGRDDLMLKNVIKELRIANNLTQEEVSNYLHIQRTTYTRYETGTNSLNFEALCQLADLYNVSTDYLLERNQFNIEHFDFEIMHLYNNASSFFKDIALTVLKKGQDYTDRANSMNKNVYLPVISDKLIKIPVEITEKDEAIEKETVNAGDFAIIANDDSMINTHIDIGDYVVIRPQQSINLGEIALLNINNRSIIRTVIEENGLIALVPSNSSYETKYYKDSSEIYIIGKMIKIIKNKNHVIKSFNTHTLP